MPYIYMLSFKGTSKVYIGQSININKRFTAHKWRMEKGISSNRLQAAYNLYGFPELTILLECSREELNEREQEFIDKYNSLDKGLNSCTSNGYHYQASGTDSKLAKYLKEEYIAVFQDLVHTNDTLKEISERYSVSINVVTSISIGAAHEWLSKEFPEEYVMLLNKVGKRYRKDPLAPRLLVSPDGVVLEVVGSYKQFAIDNSIGGHAHLSNVVLGKRKSYKGWTKYNE